METYIGTVTHYFNHLGVAVLSLSSDLRVNEIVHIRGATTDFCQKNWSMQINHHNVETGRPGEAVAIRVIGPVRCGDKVFLAPEALPMSPDEIQEYDSWER